MTTASGESGAAARRWAASVMLALYAETPLHPGSGQSPGVVDLPVQRERHTHFPIVPATSLKGSLRRVAERHWVGEKMADVLFGPRPQGGGNELHAGALAFADARVLAFPVRSMSDVFLWVTCPLVLGRLARDLRLIGAETPGLFLASAVHPGEGEIWVADGRTGTVVLEDLSFQATSLDGWGSVGGRLAGFLPTGEAHSLYREKFARHLALINDSDFTYLVRNATQVTARIALNEQKTTSGNGGNLWYEETLPADTLFTMLVLAEAPRAPEGQRVGATCALDIRDRFLELVGGDPCFVQVGGNETVGQGWCAMRVVNEEGGGHG